MGANSTKAARHVLNTRPHVLKHDLRTLFAHAAESKASQARRRDRGDVNRGDQVPCAEEPACMAAVVGGGDGLERGALKQRQGDEHGRAYGREGCAEGCGEGCAERFADGCAVEWLPSSSSSASPMIPFSAPNLRRFVPPPYASSSCSSPCSIPPSCCHEGYGGVSSSRDSSDAFDVAGGSSESYGRRPQTPLLLLEWQEKVVGEVGEVDDGDRGESVAVGGERGGEIGEGWGSRNWRRGGGFRSESEDEEEEDETFRKEGFIVRRRNRGGFEKSAPSSSDSNNSFYIRNVLPRADCAGSSNSQPVGEVTADEQGQGEEMVAGVGCVRATTRANALVNGSGSRVDSRSEGSCLESGSQRGHKSGSIKSLEVGGKSRSAGGVAPGDQDYTAAEGQEAAELAADASGTDNERKSGVRKSADRAFWSGHLDVRSSGFGAWSKSMGFRREGAAPPAAVEKKGEKSRYRGAGLEPGDGNSRASRGRFSSGKYTSRGEKALLAAVERLIWHRIRTRTDEPVVPEVFFAPHECQGKR